MHADLLVNSLSVRIFSLNIEAKSADTVCLCSSLFYKFIHPAVNTLAECHRVTRPGGLLVVLMPNIRHLPGRYWDYLDHHLPLTDLSVQEALGLSGYEVVRRVGRFLPYTVKDARFQVRPLMVRGYLRLPLAWRVLGRQMLVVGRRS